MPCARSASHRPYGRHATAPRREVAALAKRGAGGRPDNHRGEMTPTLLQLAALDLHVVKAIDGGRFQLVSVDIAEDDITKSNIAGSTCSAV